MTHMKVELIDNSVTIFLPELFDYYSIKKFISNSQQFSECDSIVIDFKDTKYIDSPAIATLFRLKEIVKERNCVKIVNIRQNLYELLVMTGYVGLLGEDNFLVK